MNQFVNAMQKQANKTETLNGAKAYKSTKNAILDLFSSWGGMRGQDINPLLRNALNADISLTLRCLLWGRDIRGGAGERELFRNSISYLANIGCAALFRMLPKIPEVGRWDDLFVLHRTSFWPECCQLITNALKEGNGLCAKWMPRKGEIAESLRAHMRLTPKQYRKLLVGLTNVVETQMCANKWDDINYEHVPSKATQIYKNAFKRHSPQKYETYLQSLVKGTAKTNAGAVYPYEIIQQIKEPRLMEAQWKAQPNYIEDGMSFLPVIDVSGSMMCPVSNTTAMNIAMSLGIYLSERNKSVFKDMFVTFSQVPEFHHLQGNLTNRLNQLRNAKWGMNTDIDAVFTKLLEIAMKNKVTQEEMPTHIIIVSDMQFDYCCKNTTNQKNIFSKYKDCGYKPPVLVFWNVNDHGNKPVTENRENTVLVSGFSPSVMKTLLKADTESITPIAQMMETLMDTRYDC